MINEETKRNDGVEANQPKENSHDTALYAPEILFYPSDNRVDFNIHRNSTIAAADRGFYHRGEEGPLYMILSRTPLPREVSDILIAKGLNGTTIGAAIEQMGALLPNKVDYRLTIKSSDSSLAKYGSSYLHISFDGKEGATYKTDLSDDDTKFTLEMLEKSIQLVLSEAKTGDKRTELPPGITEDPLHLMMTDQEFSEKAPRFYARREDVDKIRDQRNKTLAELNWLKLTIQEIQKKYFVK